MRRRCTADEAVIQRVAKAMLADIRGGVGSRVAALLESAKREAPFRREAGRREFAARAIGHRVSLAGDGVDTSIGECAVLWRRLEAVKAMLDVARADQKQVLGRLAARRGWEEGLRVLLADGGDALRVSSWRDSALAASARHAGCFKMLLEHPTQPTFGRGCGFFSACNRRTTVLAAMAASGQAEALWSMARTAAPTMLTDLGRALDQKHCNETLGTLAKPIAAGWVNDDGIVFLARHVCRDTAELVRLAVVVAGRGADAGQLGRACRQDEALAAAVAREAGTTAGAWRFIEAILRREKPGTGSWVEPGLGEDLLQRIAEVAALAECTPALLGSGKPSAGKAWVLRAQAASACWMAARARVALAAGAGHGQRRRA